MAETVYRVYDERGNEVDRSPSRTGAGNLARDGYKVREYVGGKRKRVWNAVMIGRRITLEPA